MAGCRREEIRVYLAPKDPPAQEVAHNPHDGHDHGNEPTTPPAIELKLSEGWREIPPGEMTVAAFSVTGPNGQEAQVTVTPLGMLAAGKPS